MVALGLSYNTDLHSGIELRRTSHKAAEQKRRDSLKNCFEDLRHMIPNIVDKAPSKVFLLKKSFDYICSLKSEIAQRDLHMARTLAQEDHFRSSLESWIATTIQSKSNNSGDDNLIAMPDLDSWKLPEEELDKITAKQIEAVKAAQEMAILSAAAVEAARIGNQPNGSNKEGKNGKKVNGSSNSGNANGNKNAGGAGSNHPINNHYIIPEEDEEDEGEDSDDGDDTESRSKSKKSGGRLNLSIAPKKTQSAITPAIDPSGDIEMSAPNEDSSMLPIDGEHVSAGKRRSRSTKSSGQRETGEEEEEYGDDDEDDDMEDEDEDGDGEEDEM
ncbi:hypothetical protein BGZ46_004264 [Entomortierella lignicola]|nr:hypothetical protein BGZ46_004264 [Entomortierella lignicola]